MTTFSQGVCWDSHKAQVAMFVMLLLSLVLNVIVADGNWRLYSRVERIESTLGLLATPQSQRKP